MWGGRRKLRTESEVVDWLLWKETCLKYLNTEDTRDIYRNYIPEEIGYKNLQAKFYHQKPKSDDESAIWSANSQSPRDSEIHLEPESPPDPPASVGESEVKKVVLKVKVSSKERNLTWVSHFW